MARLVGKVRWHVRPGYVTVEVASHDNRVRFTLLAVLVAFVQVGVDVRLRVGTRRGMDGEEQHFDAVESRHGPGRRVALCMLTPGPKVYRYLPGEGKSRIKDRPARRRVVLVIIHFGPEKQSRTCRHQLRDRVGYFHPVPDVLPRLSDESHVVQAAQQLEHLQSAVYRLSCPPGVGLTG